MNILEWAERAFRVVETDGAMVARIRLITPHDGQVWETWHRPFPEPGQWTQDLESYLRTLEQDWPSRIVPILLMAESKQGEVLSQLPHRVLGKGQKHGGSLDAVQTANAVAMDSLASTIEKLQRLINVQLEQARRSLETMGETSFQQNELIKLYRQRETYGGENEGELTPIQQMLADQLPKVFAMGELLLAAKSNGAGKAGPTIKNKKGTD